MTWMELINRILKSKVPPKEQGNVADALIAAALKSAAHKDWRRY